MKTEKIKQVWFKIKLIRALNRTTKDEGKEGINRASVEVVVAKLWQSFQIYRGPNLQPSTVLFSRRHFGKTVKPLLSRHLWDLPKCPFNRGWWSFWTWGPQRGDFRIYYKYFRAIWMFFLKFRCPTNYNVLWYLFLGQRARLERARRFQPWHYM